MFGVVLNVVGVVPNGVWSGAKCYQRILER
jgi:hypothetical protein